MNSFYQNILIPFDNSRYSKEALRFAIQFAKGSKSNLFVINVLDISSVSPPGKFHSRNERRTFNQIKKTIKSSSEAIIQKIIEDHTGSRLKLNGIVIENGSVSEKLLHSIKVHNIDLIIMGSRGFSGFSKIMALGSVSRKISELSNCPVILIR